MTPTTIITIAAAAATAGMQIKKFDIFDDTRTLRAIQLIQKHLRFSFY